MNRIDATFQSLKKRGQSAFVAFVTAGDPDLATTAKLVPALAGAGADIIELGVPFSDPLADGPTIQASYLRALEQGVTLEKVLATVRKIRSHTQVPVALMTSFNPVFHYGQRRFVENAAKAGVDGVIVPDLPPEEAGELIVAARRKGLATVFLVAPTTTDARAARIVRATRGFVYYVSLAGVTGARRRLARDVRARIRHVKRLTDKPVCVGFGVSLPGQVRELGAEADGVIVGSAIVKQMEHDAGRRDLVARTARLVARLSAPLRAARRRK